MKQAARSRCVSRTIFIHPSVLCHNRQTIAHLVLRSKPRNHSADFVGQITKPQLPVLRHKSRNPILRLNQETRSPCLLVHGGDCTQRHLTSLSSGHRVSDLCLTILSPLHQVSYSCLDPHHCSPCCTYCLHIMRQENMFLSTKQIVG